MELFMKNCCQDYADFDYIDDDSDVIYSDFDDFDVTSRNASDMVDVLTDETDIMEWTTADSVLDITSPNANGTDSGEDDGTDIMVWRTTVRVDEVSAEQRDEDVEDVDEAEWTGDDMIGVVDVVGAVVGRTSLPANISIKSELSDYTANQNTTLMTIIIFGILFIIGYCALILITLVIIIFLIPIALTIEYIVLKCKGKDVIHCPFSIKKD